MTNTTRTGGTPQLPRRSAKLTPSAIQRLLLKGHKPLTLGKHIPISKQHSKIEIMYNKIPGASPEKMMSQ